MSKSAPNLGLDAVLDADSARENLTKPLDNGAPARHAPVPLAPLNLRVPVDMVQALRRGRVEDGITAVARVKALIELWRTDEEIKARVDDLAATLKN